MRNLRPVTDSPPRATIYLRQSTFRDESISLDLQEIACRDYCDRMGYEVVAVEADPGISGRTWARPAVQRTMRAIENHETDIVILWKWSRLSRSRKDWALAIDMADVAGGRIESATEPIDTATASGRFARGVMTEYAAFQSEQIGETWEEVRQRRLNRGLPASGRLPFGWSWKVGGIERNPDQAPYVVEMYRRYLSGDGSAMIAQWLNSQNVPGPSGTPWTRVRPFTVMDSPIHAGLIPYRGETHAGAHEPIIEVATWEAYRLERKARREAGTKRRNYEHLLSALVRCECGARMDGKGSITGGKLYTGYICTDTLNGHPQRAYISARRIEPAVSNWFLTFDADLPKGSTRSRTVDRLDRDDLLRQLAELERKQTNLALELSLGEKALMPRESIRRAAAELHDQQERLRADLARLNAQEDSRPTNEMLSPIRGRWNAMTTPEQNREIRRVTARIDVLDSGERVCIRTPWEDSYLLNL